MKYVLIPTNKGTKTVLEENIIRIEACSNYCKIYFNNERPLVVAKVLHWFQDLLPEDTFCRIHRTHLVNRLYITDVLGANHLTLSNGEIIQMSRRKKHIYKTMLLQSA
jgi:two-component system, LytTR family, response regulator